MSLAFAGDLLLTRGQWAIGRASCPSVGIVLPSLLRTRWLVSGVDYGTGDVVDKVVDRAAGRVLLVDAAGRVLLLRGCDPANRETHYWVTIGGGLDDGETFAEAAARELYEETGLALVPSDLKGPVWTNVSEFSFDGTRYRQRQEFFVARVEQWEPSRAGFDDHEQQFIDSFGWWSLADLLSPHRIEQVYPPELPEILQLVV